MHQYSFMPFGQGPRMCPGQKLAMIQVKMAIINILKNYSLETSKNTEVGVLYPYILRIKNYIFH